VIEYVFTSRFDGAGVVTGLLLFRAIYYLLPLFVGFAVWLADKISGRRSARRQDHDLKAQNALYAAEARGRAARCDVQRP